MIWESLGKQRALASYRVAETVWKDISTEPKTTKSKAPIPIIGLLSTRLEEHRWQCGNPHTGCGERSIPAPASSEARKLTPRPARSLHGVSNHMNQQPGVLPSSPFWRAPKN